jgi:replicative DNA helicase
MRNNKRPQLSDLRESGQIEQDADVVAFVYREDYYDPATDKKGITEVILAKQRNGPVGTVELRWDARLVSFSNLAKGA